MRERQVAEMNAIEDHSESNLAQVAPVLDEAIGQLDAEDRTAILLRFFERKDFRSVGEAIGSSEDAARKRVDRALEKLHVLLKHRGATLSAVALGTTLATEAVTAAPVGLAATISAAALAGTTLATATTATAAKAIAMTTFQKTLIAATCAAAVGMGIYEARQAAQLRDQVQTFQQQQAPLAEQAAEAAGLREDNQRLRDQLKTAAEASEANSRELLRLRAQAGTSRQVQQENARLKSERDRLAEQPPTPSPEEPPWDRLFGQGGNAKMQHAMRWGTALINYASQHQGQFPTSFQEAAPFMDEDLSAEGKAQTASTTDQYEILYHGRREDMTNPPPEGAILIREKKPWQTTQGTWARTYIYGTGAGTIHTEPDGSFEKWEAPRLPKSNGQ